MSAAAEHALRTLAEEFDAEATGDGIPPNSLHAALFRGMANAHRNTANRLQAEREELEAKLRHNPGQFKYVASGQSRTGRS